MAGHCSLHSFSMLFTRPIFGVTSVWKVSMSSYSRFFTVKEALNLENSSKQVIIKGWVKAIRKQKVVSFIHINDGSTPHDLQVVLDKRLLNPDISYGSSIEVEGELRKSTHPKQPVELETSRITVLGACNTEEYPFKVRTHHSTDYIRQYPHLRPRTRQFSSLLRLRNNALMAAHDYFQRRGFIHVHTPLITSSDCEGAGELFQVLPARDLHQGEGSEQRFFNGNAYLTVSGQLQAESAMSGLSKVYTLGPTFRAESSHTSRHLAEFYMLEAETIFKEVDKGLEELLELTEAMCKHVIRSMADNLPEDFAVFSSSEDAKNAYKNLVEKDYERVTYLEAIDILQQSLEADVPPPKVGEDLSNENERHLVELCGSRPVFVVDYPTTPTLKPFYAKHNSNGATVQAFDLLMPGIGEVVGGSVREDSYDVLKERIDNLNIDTANYQWYLDLRKYGSVPHGGFGVGFDRLLQCALGVNNIRDVVLFPRYLGHCS